MRSNKGSILIELLIAISIGVFLSIAIIVFYSSLIGSKSELINRQVLKSQLENSLSLMQKHIVRAGYWAGITTNVETGSNNNPFIENAVDLQINASNSCILFAYDVDKSGGAIPSLNTGGSDERFGFKRIIDVSTGAGVIVMRPLTSANFSCSSGLSDWVEITDPNVINVTSLAFSLTEVQAVENTDDTGNIFVRSIAISISASSLNDSVLSDTVTSEVRVKNDKYTPNS